MTVLPASSVRLFVNGEEVRMPPYTWKPTRGSFGECYWEPAPWAFGTECQLVLVCEYRHHRARANAEADCMARIGRWTHE
jgi:hypothetical protein